MDATPTKCFMKALSAMQRNTVSASCRADTIFSISWSLARTSTAKAPYKKKKHAMYHNNSSTSRIAVCTQHRSRDRTRRLGCIALRERCVDIYRKEVQNNPLVAATSYSNCCKGKIRTYVSQAFKIMPSPQTVPEPISVMTAYMQKPTPISLRDKKAG